jgi:DNA mismatch endonuclease (patch repair protein)
MSGRRKSRRQRRKAGHRSWAAGNAPVSGTHQGDIMSPETRSRVMARIKGRNTRPERVIFVALEACGLPFTRHADNLPGRPDIVFDDVKLAVFIDGDFWHGWRFPLWEHKLSEKWRNKIAATRKRDQRNFCRLRREGWRVIRIWEHQVESDPAKCVARILAARESRLAGDCPQL